MKTLAAGTTLDLEFLDGVSSKTSQPGNTFRARVVRDVEVDGVAVVPAGSIVMGRVREATATKKIGGKAKLTLEFAELQPRNGRAAAIQASWSQEGKSETAKDAATIGGATAGGALLGRLLGKDGDKNKATAIGAVVGAAAGTAVAAKTAGQEVEVPAGSTLAIVLDAPVQMTVLP